jgi:CHASE2 domain-containing sensor protein
VAQNYSVASRDRTAAKNHTEDSCCPEDSCGAGEQGGFNDKYEYIRYVSIFDRQDFAQGRVRTGYINLPYDLRRAPLALAVANSDQPVDSFSLAIVYFVDSEAYNRVNAGENTLPFTSYISEQAFYKGNEGNPKTAFSATEILQANEAELRTWLAGRIVIIGAGWHQSAYRIGPAVDLHGTPAGAQPGAMVHANYVEAMLAERTYKPVGEWLVYALEAALVIFVACIMKLEIGLGAKLLLVMSSCLFFIFLSYFFLQNLGRFFDFLVPVVVLGGHLAWDKIMEWRRLAHSYETKVQT